MVNPIGGLTESESESDTGEEFTREDLDSQNESDMEIICARQLQTGNQGFEVPGGLPNKVSYIKVGSI